MSTSDPRLRLAYLGNFRPSTSTETHVAASLEMLGHEVVRLQEGDTDFGVIPGRVVDCDALLWTRTGDLDTQPQELQRYTLDELERLGVPSIALHLDKYWDLPREAQIGQVAWWNCRWVFSADGGNDERFETAGIQRHRWFQPGVFLPEAELVGHVRDEYLTDVAFVGGANGYHPEWPFRTQLVQWLHETYRQRYKHFGGGMGPSVRGQDLNDVYASATVVVGDSCNVGGTGYYWSDRVPETIGRGGFLLHPRVEGLEDFYTDGEHLVLFDRGDWSQLKRLIDYYVQHPDEALEIAEAGRKHVLEHHTYDVRMAQVLDEVGLTRA